MLTRALSLVNKMGKTQDSILIGLIGGFIGTVFMDISNELIYKAGKTEGRYANVAGQMFVSPIRTKQRKNFILGEILHLAVGSVFGLPLVYILKKTGKDHYLAKGLVTSILTWGVLYTGGQKVGLFKKNHLTKSHYSAMWNNLIYGISAAKVIVSIADPAVFKMQEQETLEGYEPKIANDYMIESDIGTEQETTYLH